MKTIIAYHSSAEDVFEPRRFLHAGTLAQAKMRGGKYLYRLEISPGMRQPRMRDNGDWNVKTLMRYATRARVAVYLNRHEGIPLDEFDAARSTIDIDRLTDREFQRRLPSSADSWIVLDANAILSAERIDWP